MTTLVIPSFARAWLSFPDPIPNIRLFDGLEFHIRGSPGFTFELCYQFSKFQNGDSFFNTIPILLDDIQFQSKHLDSSSSSDEFTIIQVPFREFMKHHNGSLEAVYDGVHPGEITAIGFGVYSYHLGDFSLEIAEMKPYVDPQVIAKGDFHL